MIARWFNKLIPETFKHRILLSFLLFFLAPLAILFLYNFRETEQMLERNASEANIAQLEGMKGDLVGLMRLVMKTGMLLEQDTVLRQALQEPAKDDPIHRKRIVENKFASIENSFFLTGATVFYTLIDFHGNAYTSYAPEESLDYEALTSEPWVRELQRDGGQRSAWNPNDISVAVRERAGNKMLSLYEVLRDDGLKPFAYGRFSIDYQEWFEQVTRDQGAGDAYFLLDAAGQTMLRSDAEDEMPGAVAQSMLKAGSVQEPDVGAKTIVDEHSHMLYTFTEIQEIHAYLVKKVPLSLLYEDVTKQKQRFYAVYGVILLLFGLMSYLISATITVPLKRFQRKMETTVKSNLKLKLPERGRGEILALTRSFNAMIEDINELLNRLKLEERQKQLVRFQVLLGQMNPHFLLNTLNTIKSIALEKDEDEIYEICVGLGKILETTLNTEVDLILLKDELTLVESYMEIQRQRFGHGIQLRCEWEEDLEYALLPKFSLQPLVENALLHGFGHSEAEGEIIIRAYAQGSQLYLEVLDNGIGLSGAQEKKSTRKRKGIGLHNVRESLELMFKNQPTGLTLESLDEQTKVIMHLPLLLSKPFLKEAGADVAYPDR
ncbi:histidine kinase [Paenibacillus sp. NFR01]|uniref:sensor histidine kinase n=1 Tax=Paenibacillus sp. NFR01 TaxID=1566279 RepID=UPI0008D32CD2|nr:histidine kinase [Paenibacillus sp. NFR01]SET10062.1 Histidine kinase-, DNA gyrase B-, and HSP90-like ATPase [Paenibacillus sp. NFR01]